VMQPFYHHAITVLWLIWGFYWLIASFSTKTTRRRESAASRASHMIPLIVAGVLLSNRRIAGPYLSATLLPHTFATFWIGLFFVAFGIAFSIAGRVWLGGNWSGTVTLKDNHELIRSGPYRLVRHPIYTGILLAILGTAIAQGEWRSLIALVLITVAFLRKIAIEESFLVQEFGNSYERYRSEVPALIPLLPRM
jgi:protein-S-isoprenylcysteine O-methyltransferase Ste14